MRHLTVALLLMWAFAACEEEGTGGADTTQVEAGGDVAVDAVPPDGADTDAVDPACPAEAPIGDDASCQAGTRCEYGQECCCGQCHPSLVCQCGGGSWGCYYTDACMLPGCPDAVDAGDTSDATDGSDAVDASDATDASDAGDTTDASDTLDTQDPSCPSEAPLGLGEEDCDVGLRCEYGQECCCGQCYPSLVCECYTGGGSGWGCYNTDACMIPGCPDEPPPAGACRADKDCSPNESCRRPDEPTPCGMCYHPEPGGWLAPCEADADCEADSVCEWTEWPEFCLCESAMLCVPACADDGACAEAQRCEAGHCVPLTCEGDADCPPLFECPLVGRAGPAPCMRRGCVLDADCPLGHCVDGRCYDTFGACMLPVP